MKNHFHSHHHPHMRPEGEGDHGRRGRRGPSPEGFGGPGFGGPGLGGFGRGFGFGPFGGPGFGPGGHRGRGGRARRGDVRLAALLLIAEGPRNGYQIIQELGERSEGAWKPSPGAIYPALSQLTDEGLIRETEVEGRKVFEITEAGRAEAEQSADRQAPWEQASEGIEGSPAGQLFRAFGSLAQAAKAVAQTGDEALVQQATDLVTDARKKLYSLLAEH
ncbi:PadR family transcriptional regulator [Aestuariimicrobium soli]|uniref:PadR family transcriptional regulator n=1 Tax=Aestuariimicrobium soli TaxID=2035834 RepID=UPI003EBF4D3D